MKNAARMGRIAAITFVLLLACIIAFAQGGGFGGGGGGGGRRNLGGGGRGSSTPANEWTLKAGFEQDAITFVRIWVNGSGRGGGWGGGSDFPGAENNLSYRLQQLTSMQMNPHPERMELTDPRLLQYPFIFMNDPRALRLSDEEVKNLRKYLLNGGFLMIDDFWGPYMLDNFKREMAKVLPGKRPESLPLDHELFQFIYKFQAKPQIPSDDSAWNMKDDPDPARRTWEYDFRNMTPQPADFIAYFDDKGRMIVLICHNNDLSDGWEREDGWADPEAGYWFFTTYSQPLGYPMAINIFFYALTH